MKSSMLSGISNRKQTIKIVAWSITILLSWFPDILYYELTGNVPFWLVWGKVGLIFTFIVLSLLWKEIRILRNYALLFGVMWLSFKVFGWISRGSWFQSLIKDMTAHSSHILLEENLELLPVAIMILTLLLLLGQWRRFFFAKGDIRVDTDPVPLMGISAGTSVRTFGSIITKYSIFGLLLMLVLSLQPSLSMIIDVLPLLPVIIIAALLNSFSEEVIFRASLLSVSHEVVGKGQAIWMTAFVFGSAHYIGGQPSLLLGFVLTTWLGWAWAKVMLESRSILLPWAMHFVLDAIIFIFNEMGVTLAR